MILYQHVALISCNNALVKLLNPHPPRAAPGKRENMRVIKKGGALEKRAILVIM